MYLASQKVLTIKLFYFYLCLYPSVLTLYLHIYICLSVSAYLFAYRSTYLPICLCIYLSGYLFIWLSDYALFVCLPLSTSYQYNKSHQYVTHSIKSPVCMLSTARRVT